MLSLHPRSSDEVAALMGCPGDAVESILWALGFTTMTRAENGSAAATRGGPHRERRGARRKPPELAHGTRFCSDPSVSLQEFDLQRRWKNPRSECEDHRTVAWRSCS